MKKTVPKTREHLILFHRDSPFKPKVVKDRTKYSRVAKHKKSPDFSLSVNFS